MTHTIEATPDARPVAGALLPQHEPPYAGRAIACRAAAVPERCTRAER